MQFCVTRVILILIFHSLHKITGYINSYCSILVTLISSSKTSVISMQAEGRV
jgi:hypothetical protein